MDRDQVMISLLSDLEGLSDAELKQYDLETIVANASIDENGTIVVKSKDFEFGYDPVTYAQIYGVGLIGESI
jgi:hypothetical protein